jgi:hypothetical protein
MSYFVWRGENEEQSARLLEGFFRISAKLTSDFACMVISDAMTGGGVLDSAAASEKLFCHPSYKEWRKIHGAAMKKHFSC